MREKAEAPTEYKSCSSGMFIQVKGLKTDIDIDKTDIEVEGGSDEKLCFCEKEKVMTGMIMCKGS